MSQMNNCLGALACLVATGLAGCAAPAWVAETIRGGEKVAAAYELADRSTVILVDDPHGLLGHPTLPAVIAETASRQLRENEVLTAPIVPEKQVAALAAKLGSDFATTPIDEVGRLLGAEQVIHGFVQDVRLLSAPGMYRPTAVMEVKVVDAVAGKRLYPKPPAVHDPQAPVGGRTFTVQLSHRGVNSPSRGAHSAMVQQLAEQIGVDLAQMFYKHK